MGAIKEPSPVASLPLRETKEETGITITTLDPNFKEIEKYFYKREGELINKTINYYLTSVPYDTPVEISEEHISYEWATKDRSMELLKIKPAKEMLEKAINHVTNGKSQLSML
jgi:8-oxo-dGTP pyrophosphatase MutT (NUDIX family)